MNHYLTSCRDEHMPKQTSPMKQLLDYIPVRWLGMAVWGLFVLLLTTLPAHVPLVSVLSELIGGTEPASMVGHVGLFAILTLLTCGAMMQWFSPRYAVPIAMMGVLLLGTTTEFFQWFVLDRNSTMGDLFANWLGVFMAGFLVSYWLGLRKLYH
jgi:VanZ family protein